MERSAWISNDLNSIVCHDVNLTCHVIKISQYIYDFMNSYSMWNCNIMKFIPASWPYFSCRATLCTGIMREYSLFLCVYLTCGISTLAIKLSKWSLHGTRKDVWIGFHILQKISLWDAQHNGRAIRSKLCESSHSVKGGEFFDWLSNHYVLKKDSTTWSWLIIRHIVYFI